MQANFLSCPQIHPGSGLSRVTDGHTRAVHLVIPVGSNGEDVDFYRGLKKFWGGW